MNDDDDYDEDDDGSGGEEEEEEEKDHLSVADFGRIRCSFTLKAFCTNIQGGERRQ